MTPHQFLKEIYKDFCSKHHMQKHNGEYLSADDYLYLGKDGRPIYREDGKVLKGPDYEPPTLTDLI